MACDDRQLTEAQRVAGYQNQRTGVQQAVRPFTGRPTLENLIDYINRELQPAVKRTRDKVNDIYLPTVDNAPSGNPLGFYFSTDTTDADPTTGRIRLNTATQDTATVIRVSESNGRLADVAPWLDVMSGGATTPLGVVTLTDAINPSRFIRFDLNTMTDVGAYWNLGVTPIESSHDNPFVDSGAVVLSFIPGVGGATPATIPPSAITPIAANSVLGNPTASTAAPQAISVAASRFLGRAATGNFGAITGAQGGEIIRRLTVQSDSTSSGSIATYTINEATTQVRFSGSGTATIHGMTATAATFGKMVEFHVESGVAGQLVFSHESGSAGAAGERLRTPSGETLYLRANESVYATYYDNRWRLSGVGKASASRLPGAPLYDVMAPPFNAAGDGTTDDTAAINAAIAAANAVPGDIYLGPGHRITAPLDIISSSNIEVIGRGPFGSGTRISVDSPLILGGDVFAFEGCQYSGIRDVWIIGSNVYSSGFAVNLQSCFRPFVTNVVISQMFNGVHIDRCTLANIETCNLNDLYGPYGFFAHGDSADACHGTSLWDCSCGTPFPQGHVGPGRAWATSTAYIVGNVVFANGNLYQCVQAGTSSGAGTGPSGFPSTNPSTVHTTQITDGSARWVFAMPLNAWFHQGSYAATFEVTDSGALQGGYGIKVEDTDPGAGSVPLFTRIFNFQADHVFGRGVLLQEGAEARISNLLITSMVEGFGIEIASTFSGDWEFVGGTIFGCNKGGALVRCGDGLIMGMQIGGVSGESANTYDCIAVENSADNWAVIGCSCGTLQGDPTPSSRYGISVAAGSDNYVVLGNRCVANVTAGILNTPGRSSTRVVLNNIPDVTIAPGSVWGLQVDGSTGVPLEITGAEVGELIRRIASVADSTSTGSVATYAIANTTTQVRFTGSAAATIHGMTATSATFGKTVEFHVESGAAAVITFSHESGSAGAANERLRTPSGASLSIAANESVQATYYDNRWRFGAVGKSSVLSDGDKGDITVSASGATWTIDNNAVTLAKMATIAQSRFIGGAEGAGTATPTALTPTQAMAIIDAENATWTGTHTFNNDVILGEIVRNTAIYSDAALAADQTDLAIGAVSACRFATTGGSPPYRINSMVATASDQLVWIENADSADGLLLTHEHSGSTAANRFVLPGNIDLYMPPRSGVWGRRDGTSSRWFVSGGGHDSRVLEIRFSRTPDASITITPPAGATWFEVECLGGGGGGGGADADSVKESCAGAGGGAGGWFRHRRAITSGNITGAIGGGGNGGTNTGGDGGDGDATFYTYDGTGHSAAGGIGGAGSSTGPTGDSQLSFTAGGNGGSPDAGATERTDGGDGHPGMAFSVSANPNSACGGHGGASAMGGGGRGGATSVDSGTETGASGSALGSGGGGGARTSTGAASTGATGGSGLEGYMKVTFWSGPVPTDATIS